MPRGGTGFMILGDSEGGDVRLRETRGCGMRGGGRRDGRGANSKVRKISQD